MTIGILNGEKIDHGKGRAAETGQMIGETTGEIEVEVEIGLMTEVDEIEIDLVMIADATGQMTEATEIGQARDVDGTRGEEMILETNTRPDIQESSSMPSFPLIGLFQHDEN